MGLQRESPLKNAYSQLQAGFAEVDGWQMPVDCGQTEKEKKQIEEGCVLADWSHISKVIVRGNQVQEAIAGLNPDAVKLPVGTVIAQKESAILRITSDEYLILSLPGEEAAVLSKTQNPGVKSYAVAGGLGCMVLAGKRRDEVWERSTAMDLFSVNFGKVIQTSVHSVHCTIYRMANKDLIVCKRDLAHFLMDALMDVGSLVGLMPTGMNVVTVSFE